MKKFICVLLSFIMLLSLPLHSYAAEDSSKIQQYESVELELDYNSAVSNADGTTTYNVLNTEELANLWGMRVDEVKEIKYVAFAKAEENFPNPRASVFIDNVSGPNAACGVKKICENSATNNLNKNVIKDITLTGSVSNTYSLSVESGIEVEVVSISSAVGFDVTYSWTMSDSTQVELAPGESVTVTAFPLYDIYEFDVYRSSFWTGTTKVGSGLAYETTGFCTVVS